MMMRQVGSTEPWTSPPGIVAGPSIKPVWHCLLVESQREQAAREHLRANGVYAFYPSREVVRHRMGRVIRQERPEVTGYVFAQFRAAPQWHVIRARWRLFRGVIACDGVPVAINRDVIRQLQGLTVEAQKLEEARREMRRIREGDKAQIIEGPLKGFWVDVREVQGGEALITGAFGLRTRAQLALMRRVVPQNDRPEKCG